MFCNIYKSKKSLNILKRHFLKLFILFLMAILNFGCGSGSSGGSDNDNGDSSSQSHWAKSYGTNSYDSASSVRQTSDGGYIVAGGTGSVVSSDSDLVIMKLNSEGAVVWQKLFDGGYTDGASSVEQTNDGGYIVAGIIELDGVFSLKYDCWVIKLDSSANIIWEKKYGGTEIESVSSIKQTSGGGYVVTGSTRSYGVGGSDIWVIKLDSSGDITWQKTYGEAGSDYASSIHQTSDGGYILEGSTNSFGQNRIWVFKLDSVGSIIWQRTYGGNGWPDARSLQKTTDGGFIIAGRTYGNHTDFWVIKLDSTGSIVWQRTYGGTQEDGADSIYQTSDGGYIVAGSTFSFGAGSFDIWVIKLNPQGDIMWQKTYGGAESELASSIIQSIDGSYILSGSTLSFGAGNRDMWILKLKADGTISATAPLNIGADTTAVVIDTTETSNDTSVFPNDSTTLATVTSATRLDFNAIVQTQAAD